MLPQRKRSREVFVIALFCGVFCVSGCESDKTAVIVPASTGKSPVSTSTTPVSPSPAPVRPPVASQTFSVDLNSSSVFIGASIIHRWPLPLHNQGIDGQTTREVLARFRADVVGHGYSRVIILCGSNDILQNTPDLDAEATANLRSMSQIAKAEGMEVVLSKLPPASQGGVDFSSTISTLNASIARLALEQGDLIVDYFTPMLGHPEYFADGLHPDAAGYDVMEKALSSVLH